MIALVLTLVLFPLAGFASALLLRLPLPSARVARVAFTFLLGLGVHGALLYVLGAMRVPLGAIAFLAVPLLSLIAIAFRWRSAATLQVRDEVQHRVSAFVFALPLVVLFVSAFVMPTRDYDGRVTWLPKARAIALEQSVAGPFFHGQRGLNLHNRYPLLLPIDVASVMHLSGDTRNETARWIYVLIPIAALLVLRSMLCGWFGASGAWTAAAIPWLPVLTSVEGGALAAYNDFALMAFAGVAVLYLIEALDDPRALRVVGWFAAFAVLAKNEGAALAIAIVIAAMIARVAWLRLLVPVAMAEALVVYWRTLVPPAYDEQYEVLMRTLPHHLGRIPSALLAIARHAMMFSEWGWFWIVAALAIVVCAMRDRSKRFAVPLVMMLASLGAYTAALTVTSWNIAELAPVAVPRLLAHLIVPAACVIAMAMRAIGIEERAAR